MNENIYEELSEVLTDPDSIYGIQLELSREYKSKTHLDKEPYDAFTKPMDFNIRMSTPDEWANIRKILNIGETK